MAFPVTESESNRGHLPCSSSVIAGNIKSLLPGSCQLSLPQVMQTTPDGLNVPHAELVSALVFDCQAQPLLVSLWKRSGLA